MSNTQVALTKFWLLEMGGNNPLIVSQVSDPRAAVHEIIQSAYISAGQRCTCARRLYVHKGEQGDQLVDLLVSAIGKIRAGLYDDLAPFMGSVISFAAAQQLLSAQQRLINKGAKALLVQNTGLLSPALLDVTHVTDLPDEEHFGPLLTLAMTILTKPFDGKRYKPWFICRLVK